MGNIGKFIIFGGIAAAGIALASKAQAGNRLRVQIQSAGISGFKRGSLQVFIKVIIDNPSNTSINISQPFLSFDLQGKPLANSVPITTVTKIPARKRITLPKLEIPINIFSAGPSIATAVLALINGGLEDLILEAKVSLTADGFNINSSKTFKLKEAKAEAQDVEGLGELEDGYTKSDLRQIEFGFDPPKPVGNTMQVITRGN